MRWWWRNHSVGGTSWNQRRRVAPYCGGATAEGTLTEGSYVYEEGMGDWTELRAVLSRLP